MTRPHVHCLVYGPPGSKKTTFASTWPKPIKVLAFDPPGKMGPFLRQGDRFEEFETEQKRAVTRVYKADDLVVEIESFIDTEVDARGNLVAHAYRDYLKRFPAIYNEVREGQWATLVPDSLTLMARAARCMYQFLINPTYKDPRKWYAEATDQLELMVGTQLVGLRANVCVIAHVDKDKDDVMGMMVGQPAAPGRLSKSDGLAAGYPEMYYAYAHAEKQGDAVKYFLQTKPSQRYNCNSALLNAPNPIEDPTFEKLWAQSPWKA